MPVNEPKTTDVEPTAEAPIVVLWSLPVDPGDAGGMGNGDDRIISSGTLHDTAEQVRANGTAWVRG